MKHSLEEPSEDDRSVRKSRRTKKTQTPHEGKEVKSKPRKSLKKEVNP